MSYQLPIITVKTIFTDSSFPFTIHIYFSFCGVYSIAVCDPPDCIRLLLILAVASKERVEIPAPVFDRMFVVHSVHLSECRLHWEGEEQPHSAPPAELSQIVKLSPTRRLQTSLLPDWLEWKRADTKIGTNPHIERAEVCLCWTSAGEQIYLNNYAVVSRIKEKIKNILPSLRSLPRTLHSS